MNKGELINQLNQKYYRVLNPEFQQDIDGIKKYVVRVFDIIDANILITNNINFYVENEGLANELAFWQGSEPKPITPSFTLELNQFISNKIQAGIIEAGFIENVSETDETAICYAYKIQGTDLIELKVLVDKDDQGELQYRVIT